MEYKTFRMQCLIFHTFRGVDGIAENICKIRLLCLWSKHEQLHFKEQSAFYARCLPISPVSSNMLICGLPNTGASSASALMLRLLAASCRLLALM
jgi:hypothetical protein